MEGGVKQGAGGGGMGVFWRRVIELLVNSSAMIVFLKT